MEEILVQLEDLMSDLINTTLGGSGLLGAAKIIAGVGFIIFAYFEGYHQLLGEKWDWKKLGAPLAIILGITFYGTFLDVVNSLLDNVSAIVKTQLNIEENNFYTKLDAYKNDNEKPAIDEELEAKLNQVKDKVDVEITEENKGFFGNLFSGVAKDMEAAFMGALFWLFKGLAQIAIMILLIVRTFFLIVLSIFGIFAISFSIYPPLKGSFATWLQKYVNVYLWLPISYIMEYILVKVMGQMELGNTAGSSGDFSNLTLLLISLAAIIGFALVPTLSGWFLSAATVSAASKLKDKTSNVGQKGGKGMDKVFKKSPTPTS